MILVCRVLGRLSFLYMGSILPMSPFVVSWFNTGHCVLEQCLKEPSSILSLTSLASFENQASLTLDFSGKGFNNHDEQQR